MAMALHATIKPIRVRFNNGFLIIARITPSGNYTALGDLLNFETLGVTSKKQPKAVFITSSNGFVYSYDLTNKKVRVWVNTAGAANAALGEHTAAALVAGVLADEITAFIFFG